MEIHFVTLLILPILYCALYSGAAEWYKSKAVSLEMDILSSDEHHCQKRSLKKGFQTLFHRNDIFIFGSWVAIEYNDLFVFFSYLQLNLNPLKPFDSLALFFLLNCIVSYCEVYTLLSPVQWFWVLLWSEEYLMGFHCFALISPYGFALLVRLPLHSLLGKSTPNKFF